MRILGAPVHIACLVCLVLPAGPAAAQTAASAPLISYGTLEEEGLDDALGLFPGEHGLTAIYDRGRLIRVYDVEGSEGRRERVFRRQGDQVVEEDVRHYRLTRYVVQLVGYLDPTTGEPVQLASRETLPVALAGEPGSLDAAGPGYIRYEGIQEVTIGERTHRAARMSFLDGERQALRREWIDLVTGVPVLETKRSSAGSWRVLHYLSDLERCPAAEVASRDLGEYLRTRVLELGPSTIAEPGLDGQVPPVRDDEIDPGRRPVAPRERPVRVLVREILVRHGGASGRTAQQAAERARALVRLARKRGTSFAEVARWFSDAPSASSGGYRGILGERELREGDPLARAAFSMGPGQVSDPVALEGCLVILRREPLAEMCGARIMVGFEGSRRPLRTARERRDRAAAQQLLEDLRDRVRGGASFLRLARQHSETPEARFGGRLGVVTAGDISAAAFTALAGLEDGQVSEIVEETHGLAIYQRLPLVQARGIMILIAWTGSGSRRPRVARTREEALGLARQLRERLEAGADPRELAREYSDDPAVATTAGDTGLVSHPLPAHMRGLMRLEPGERLGPVEGPDGYYLLVRVE